MLTWYDITAALTSRNGPIFPREYYESLAKWRKPEEWSMLALNGCPDSFFTDIYDLAIGASRPERLEARDVAFMESRLWNSVPDFQGAEPGSLIADQVLRLHEIWKLSLLLYSLQTLHRRSRDDIIRSNPHRKDLALRINTIIFNLPPDSPVQKKCLLPVFLSAAELPRSENGRRAGIREYGKRWKRITGLWIYDAAYSLLEKLWQDIDESAESNMAASIGGDRRGSTSTGRTNTGFSQGKNRSEDDLVGVKIEGEMNTPRTGSLEDSAHPQPDLLWWGDFIPQKSTSGYLFG